MLDDAVVFEVWPGSLGLPAITEETARQAAGGTHATMCHTAMDGGGNGGVAGHAGSSEGRREGRAAEREHAALERERRAVGRERRGAAAVLDPRFRLRPRRSMRLRHAASVDRPGSSDVPLWYSLALPGYRLRKMGFDV